MKRILIFLVVGALAIGDALAQKASPSVTATSDAETKPIRYYPPNIIYVHAGYCTSWISSCGLTSSARPGYEVGITDRIRVGRRLPFYLRTGADFISKGYEINGFDDSRTTLNYIQIPVEADYTISLNERFALIPFAGLYYAVGVSGKRKVNGKKTDIFSNEGGFSRHDAGLSCGVDATFHRFVIGVNYHIGLVNIDKTDTMYGDNSNKVGYKNVRNRCFVIGIGFNF